MVESGYIRNGVVAGAVSGLVTATYTYLTLPSTEEVIDALRNQSITVPMPEDVLESYIGISLMLSGLFIVIFMLVIGVLFGAVHGYIDKRSKLPTYLTALVSGFIFTALVTLPNIVLSGSPSKTVSNFAMGIIYAIALTILAILWDPKKYREDIYTSADQY